MCRVSVVEAECDGVGRSDLYVVVADHGGGGCEVRFAAVGRGVAARHDGALRLAQGRDDVCL